MIQPALPASPEAFPLVLLSSPLQPFASRSAPRESGKTTMAGALSRIDHLLQSPSCRTAGPNTRQQCSQVRHAVAYRLANPLTLHTPSRPLSHMPSFSESVGGKSSRCEAVPWPLDRHIRSRYAEPAGRRFLEVETRLIIRPLLWLPSLPPRYESSLPRLPEFRQKSGHQTIVEGL